MAVVQVAVPSEAKVMRGATGTSQTFVRILSGSKKATDKRQKRLKKATASSFINPMRYDHLPVSERSVIMNRALKRMQRLNDLDRNTSDLQFWHTLVRGGVVALRHQMLSALAARKLNRYNQLNRLNLYWVMGRQKLAQQVQ